MTEDENLELKKLGETLRVLRQNKNISQERFAELSGMDRTYVSGLERGKRNPSYLILKKISDVLEIEPDVLFGRR